MKPLDAYSIASWVFQGSPLAITPMQSDAALPTKDVKTADIQPNFV